MREVATGLASTYVDAIAQSNSEWLSWSREKFLTYAALSQDVIEFGQELIKCFQYRLLGKHHYISE